MDSSEDKQWASKYLLDPLTAPQPHQETGPGTHFSSTVKPTRESSAATYPTPPTSASPNRSNFHSSNPYSQSHRQKAFGSYAEDDSRPLVGTDKSKPSGGAPSRRRGSSLGERFPGDMSHRPLDLLRKEAKAANRAPHLKKKHILGADLIDTLDGSAIGGAYHHGGPYDATLLARNMSLEISPVAAVKETNAEALKATPREHIRDALDKHMPLQGTAIIPSGAHDMSGQPLDYEEGADLMREEDAPGGAYKRWPGIQYHPNDLKGKGEPSFAIEKALKDHKNGVSSHRRMMSLDAYEMQPRSRSASARQRSMNEASVEFAAAPVEAGGQSSKLGSGVGRSNTTGRRVSEGLKRRFGSLRRSKRDVGEA